MADYTELPSQSGGDKILVDATTDDDGVEIKTQVVELGVGVPAEIPRPVGVSNPYPIHDRAVWLVLCEILSVLREILAHMKHR